MDLENVIAELRQERDRIHDAVLSLERLARSGRSRRGRPPAWITEIRVKRRGRPPGSKNKAKPESGRTPTAT